MVFVTKFVIYSLLLLNILFSPLLGMTYFQGSQNLSSQVTKPLVYCQTEQHYQKMQIWVRQKPIEEKIKRVFRAHSYPNLFEPSLSNNELKNYRTSIGNYLTSNFDNLFSYQFDAFSAVDFCQFPDLETDLDFFLLTEEDWDNGGQNLINYHLLRLWMTNLNIQQIFYQIRQRLSLNEFNQFFVRLNKVSDLFQTNKLTILPAYWTLKLKPYANSLVITPEIIELIDLDSNDIVSRYKTFINKSSNAFFVPLIALILLSVFGVINFYFWITTTQKSKKT